MAMDNEVKNCSLSSAFDEKQFPDEIKSTEQRYVTGCVFACFNVAQ